MKVAFRVDASVLIGSGHVMRCLTLATGLWERGAQCHFICREHSGNLIGLVRERGFDVSVLAPVTDARADRGHASWLGCDWQTDAEQTMHLLGPLEADWLVVDHYGLDARWEAALRTDGRKLLVIDDLADRPHVCDLLLDQNLGRAADDYLGLVPERCALLIGPGHALLRPEFAALRAASLRRRQAPVLHNILITMGGVDQPNASGRVLQALAGCDLARSCRITVVMGSQAPWIEAVRSQAQRLPLRTEVVVSVDDMAQRMADSDLAIGAAGGTSWERCSVGVPTLLVELAANQAGGAAALAAAGAAIRLGQVDDIEFALPAALCALLRDDGLRRMSEAARAIVDGCGTQRILNAMEA